MSHYMVRLGLMLSLCAALVTHTNAATIIDTTLNTPRSNTAFGMFGEGAIEANGQTFTVPNDNSVLTSVAFRISDDTIFLFSEQYPGVTRYVFAVAEWDATTNTINGPILAQSDLYSVPTIPNGNDFNFRFEWTTFNTGRLNLTPGGQYVAFVTSLIEGIQDLERDIAMIEILETPTYEGGTHVYLASTLSRPSWYEDWSDVVWTLPLDGVVNDTSFRATFVAVPEPGTLVVAGGLAMLALRRRA